MQNFICARAEAVRALYIAFEFECHSDKGIVLPDGSGAVGAGKFYAEGGGGNLRR